MAIDYIIDYQCVPKQELTTESILQRLKGRARAQAVIDLFRKNGDNRPADQIGFEMARSTPEGTEEVRVVMVKDLLEAAAELSPLEWHCQGCPANNVLVPFGCINPIEYPISGKGELWLLNQLPGNEEPLSWLLLREGVQTLNSDGSAVNGLRGEGQPYFQERGVLARNMGEYAITSNQIFEMLFLQGHIRPSYAAMLLLMFHAIPRDLEADEIIHLSESPEDAFERYPFQFKLDADDDHTIKQLKQFFHALYLAWGLNVRLLLDV